MLNIPALTWALTVALLLGGSYHLWQLFRPQHVTDRINNGLHALMNALMASMLWNLAPSALLAQIAVLAGAALWFTLQAVARPQFKLLCNGTQGKLKCAYHALTMAAGATMITLMTTHTTANVISDPMPRMADMPGMTAAHHTTTAAPDATAITGVGHASALLLTLTFTTAAATFLFFLLRRTTKTTHRPATRTDHVLEALGATTMALMFATMTA